MERRPGARLVRSGQSPIWLHFSVSSRYLLTRLFEIKRQLYGRTISWRNGTEINKKLIRRHLIFKSHAPMPPTSLSEWPHYSSNSRPIWYFASIADSLKSKFNEPKFMPSIKREISVGVRSSDEHMKVAAKMLIARKRFALSSHKCLEKQRRGKFWLKRSCNRVM